jgi:hypothetical protein
MYNKMTVVQILTDALESIYKNLYFYAVLSLLMVGILYGLAFIISASSFVSKGAILFYSFLIAILCIKLAITVHRAILIDEFNISRLFLFSSVEIIYIVKGIVVFFFAFIVILAVSFLSMGMKSLLYSGIFILSYLIARIMLVFPAIAIGEKLKIKQSWEATTGYGLKLFTLLILIPAILNALLEYMLTNNNLWLIATSMFYPFIMIFQVTVLSHCYKELAMPKNTIEISDISETK